MTAIDDPMVEVKTVLNSEFERRAADAQRLAASFLIVDDEVWFRCHEPYWSASIIPCAVKLAFGNAGSEEGAFRIDRLEAASTYALDGANREYRRERAEFEEVPPDEAPELERTGRRDDAKHFSVNLRESSMDLLPHLRFCSADVLKSWCILRDASINMERDWDHGLFLHAMDHASALVRVLDHATDQKSKSSHNYFHGSSRGARLPRDGHRSAGTWTTTKA